MPIEKSQFTFRKFPKIRRLPEEEKYYHKQHQKSLLDCIQSGQIFNISEKLDGTNAGIEVIKQDGNFDYKLMTHNFYLGEKDLNLRGFKEFAKEILIPKIKNYLQNTSNGHFYFYGEWLVPHQIDYQDNMWNHWYFLSFYDASSDIIHREASLPDRQIIAEEMDLKMPDIMFDSEKQDITPEFLNDYLGKSNTTATPNNGEGIVIECAGRRAKIRVDEFREVKKRSKSSKTHKMTSSEQFIEETLTQARFNKMIEKFKDYDQLPKEIDFKHFGEIIRPLNRALWQDIMEEEGNNVPTNFDEKAAKKFFNKRMPAFVKDFIHKNEDNPFNKETLDQY